MLRLTLLAADLKSAFREALKLAEGKVLCQANGTPVLASPCREGMFIQRLRFVKVEGSGAFAISPEILARACDLLSALSGPVIVEIDTGKFVLRSGKQLSGCFSIGVQEVQAIEVPEPLDEGCPTVAGSVLKKALRQAVLPKLSVSRHRGRCCSEIRTRMSSLEVRGANDLMESQTILPVSPQSWPSSIVLPSGLILRSLSSHALWSKPVRARASETAYLGNSRAFLTWKPSELGPFSTNYPFEQDGSVWNRPSLFSCWTRASEIVSAVRSLLKERKRHASRHILEWNAEGLTIAAVSRTPNADGPQHRDLGYLLAQGRGALSDTETVKTTSVTSVESGSMSVNTEALYVLRELYRDTEQQLRLSGSLMVFGSPSSFVVVHAS